MTDKDEFIDQCVKALRKDNPKQLENLLDFRNNYTPNDALVYYTKASFFFLILNRSLRTRDIENLFLYRFFIRDIFDRLSGNQCQHPVNVYRGQRMKKAERERLQQSIGKLISVNSFLSTSLNRNVAFCFLGHTKSQTTEISENQSEDVSEEFILFQIYADPKYRTKPFAIIEENSRKSDEEEVLFGAGSIFRIVSIHRGDQTDEDHPDWIFKMELSNGEDHELKTLFTRFRHTYSNENMIQLSLSSFGLILCSLEKIKFASKLFRRILRDHSSITLVEQARCQRIMGHISSSQHHYWQSLRWYKRSLRTYTEINSSSNLSEIASVYSGIGNVYFVRKQYQRSHISYMKSLSIWQMCDDQHQDQEEIAFCYLHQADVYLAKGYPEIASELSRKGLYVLYDCHLDTPLHINIAVGHFKLGEALVSLRMFDLAIDHYIESLSIALKISPQDDRFLYSIYSSLETTCEKDNRNFEQFLMDNQIPPLKDDVYIDHFKRNHGTPYQMVFRCSRCKQWQWIFTVFRPIKRFVCTGCWRKRCPRLMSYFRVIT